MDGLGTCARRLVMHANRNAQMTSKVRDPVNYFLLLRALFRSIGGGRFELLYKVGSGCVQRRNPAPFRRTTKLGRRHGAGVWCFFFFFGGGAYNA